jgi:hypothetical protein
MLIHCRCNKNKKLEKEHEKNGEKEKKNQKRRRKKNLILSYENPTFLPIAPNALRHTPCTLQKSKILMWSRVQFKGSICFKLLLGNLDLGLPSKVALKEEEKNSKGMMNFLGKWYTLINWYSFSKNCKGFAAKGIENTVYAPHKAFPVFHMIPMTFTMCSSSCVY